MQQDQAHNILSSHKTEYQAIEEFMEDYMDLIDLREAKAEGQGQPSVPLDEVIKALKKGWYVCLWRVANCYAFTFIILKENKYHGKN